MTYAAAENLATAAQRREALAAALRVLGDPTRLQVLIMLAEGECCVCELVDALGISQPLLSHHLRVLREQGFVSDRKSGKWSYYRLTRSAFEEISSFTRALARSRDRKRASDCS